MHACMSLYIYIHMCIFTYRCLAFFLKHENLDKEFLLVVPAAVRSPLGSTSRARAKASEVARSTLAAET